ncbi:MAG: tetratricopeptide repeat protein [Candidatus Omnitrophica bacterium]|nr:tetratricopeptide repeat protein [Candidatus Omnitrophota bacterium]
MFSQFVKLKSLLSLLGILIIVTIAFSPTLFNGFSKNDDPGHLLENPTLRALTPENIRAIFQNIINTTYNPLTILSFALEYRFFGYNPFVYHLNNLLLHLGVVSLIFFFFQRMGLSLLAASIGALIFGIHPMHVESVAWVTERKDVLYAFFYMLALLAYWNYVKLGKRSYYWGSLVCCFLSVLAKPMALSLPLILLLCDWWMGRKWTRAVFLEKIFFVTIVVTIASVTYIYNARVPWQTVSEAMMLWVWCLIFYIRKFFVPDQFITFYQFPQPLSWTNASFALSGIAGVALIFLLLYFRRNKLFIFAMLFYFLSIFFLLRFDDVENINPVSDRFMYLPSVGFCALLGAGFAWLLSHKTVRHLRKCLIVGFIVMALFLAVKTFVQCRNWRDGAILWSAVIERSPNLAMAYIQRGAAYHEKGDLVSAKADYLKAIELKNDPYAHNNLATIYKETGHFEEAESEYTIAIKIKPDFWGAYFDRGNLYREAGKLVLAIADYTKVLELLPGYAEAYAHRGTAYLLNQEDDLAFQDFNYAIRFDPRAVNAVNNRAVIYAKRGHFEKSIDDFSLSIFLDPENASVYFNRGLAYSQNRQYDRAIVDFDKALEIDPNYQQAYQHKMEIIRR